MGWSKKIDEWAQAYKYSPERIVELGDEAGFDTEDQWIEREARFSLTLFRTS